MRARREMSRDFDQRTIRYGPVSREGFLLPGKRELMNSRTRISHAEIFPPLVRNRVAFRSRELVLGGDERENVRSRDPVERQN